MASDPIIKHILDAHVAVVSKLTQPQPFDRAEMLEDIITALSDVHDIDTPWNVYAESIIKLLEMRGLIPKVES